MLARDVLLCILRAKTYCLAASMSFVRENIAWLVVKYTRRGA